MAHVDGNHQMVIQQDVMAGQMVFGEIGASLEHIGVHGSGVAFKLARDDLYSVASAEAVVKTH